MRALVQLAGAGTWPTFAYDTFMKPNSKHNRGLGSRANRVFEQARTQFGRAVIDVLSTSLEALGERLGGEKVETFQDPDHIEDQPRHRLRRMLQSDRGLGARSNDLPGRRAELAESPAEPGESVAETIAVVPAEPEPAAAAAEPVQQPEAVAAPILEPAPSTGATAAAPPEVAEPEVAASPPVVNAAESPAATANADEPPICDEPIRTRSMARLLASQGHHRRALSIYDVLLATNAADATLAAEAAALRSLAEQQPSPQ